MTSSKNNVQFRTSIAEHKELKQNSISLKKLIIAKVPGKKT